MTIFYILFLFMLVAAIIAVETKKLLGSVICIGAIGFGVSLMFLFLRAPDIAITQIVVEILGLIILAPEVKQDLKDYWKYIKERKENLKS